MNAALSPKPSTSFTIFMFFVTVTGASTVPIAKGSVSFPGAASPSNLLDGMTLVAQSGEKGKQARNKDTIEATNTWTRKRWYWNIKREYWYKGQRKKMRSGARAP